MTRTREVGMATPKRTLARRSAWRRLVSDQSGQDLIEYGLLVVTVGIAGALVFPIIQNKLATNYSANDSAIQRDWAPCDPGGWPC
jgi:Flp pilus assembly pilin Flp